MAARVEIEFAAKNASSVVNASVAADRAIRALNERGEENYRLTRKQAAEIRRVQAAFKQEAAAAREAAKMTQALQTPQEAYTASVRKLRGDLEAGRISDETYQRARKQLQQTTLQSTGAEKARSAAIAEAAAITEKTRTAEESHAQRLARLNTLLAEGRLTEETHARAVQAATVDLDLATGATQRREQAEREAARTIQSLLTPQDRYAQQLRTLSSQHASGRLTQDQYSQAVRNARKSLDDATGATERKRRAEQAAQAVIDRTRSATERYDIEVRELRQHLDEGRLSQTQFNRALADADSRLAAADRGGNRMIGTLGRMAAGFATVATAARAIRAVGREMTEFENSVDDVSERFEIKKLQLQNQAGLTDDQTTQQVEVVRKVLHEIPVTDIGGALAAQTELTSIGFNADDVASGDALREFLKIQAATGQFGPGADATKAKDTIDAAGAVLAAGGDDLTAENLGRLSGKFVNLFASTPVQAPDLPQLAEITATLQSLGISEDERLGSFATATQLLGANKGATALKQAGLFLRSAAAKKDKLREDFGLDTTGFDLIGEGLADAIANLNDQMTRLSEEQRSEATERIFGKEAGANFMTLSGNVASLRKNTLLVKGNTTQENVSRFNESEVATRQRARNEADFNRLNLDTKRGGVSFAELREMVDTALTEAELSADGRVDKIQNASSAASINAIIALQESTGGTPEQAVLTVANNLGETDVGKRFADRANQRGTDGFLFSQSAVDAATDTRIPQTDKLQETRAAAAVDQSLQNVPDRERQQLKARFDAGIDTARFRRNFDAVATAQSFLTNHAADIDRLGGNSKAGLTALTPEPVEAKTPELSDQEQRVRQLIEQTLSSLPESEQQRGRQAFEDSFANVSRDEMGPVDRGIEFIETFKLADNTTDGQQSLDALRRMRAQPAEPITLPAIPPNLVPVANESASRVVVPALTPEVNDVEQQPTSRVVVPAVEPNIAEPTTEPPRGRQIAAVTPAVDVVEQQPASRVVVPAAEPNIAEPITEPPRARQIAAVTPAVDDVEKQPASRVVVPAAEPNIAEPITEPTRVRQIAAVTPAVDDVEQQPASRVVVPAAEPNIAEPITEPTRVRQIAAVTPAVDDVEQQPGQRRRVSPVRPNVDEPELEPATGFQVPSATPQIAEPVGSVSDRSNPRREAAADPVVIGDPGIVPRDLQPLERSATERNSLLNRMLAVFEENNQLLASIGRELRPPSNPPSLPVPARRPAGNRAQLLDRRVRQ